jgi:hypothetical protein
VDGEGCRPRLAWCRRRVGHAGVVGPAVENPTSEAKKTLDA